MPAEDATDVRRGKPLATILFWSGVGLAPIAALLLLLARGNGPLRIAAVLAVLAVVLIGLSIMLRGDAETVRLELEETLLAELDRLRGEVRNEIATGSAATQRAFGETQRSLRGDLDILRNNVDVLRDQFAAARAGAAVETAGHVAAAGGAPPVPVVVPSLRAGSGGTMGPAGDSGGWQREGRGGDGYARDRYDRPEPARREPERGGRSVPDWHDGAEHPRSGYPVGDAPTSGVPGGRSAHRQRPGAAPGRSSGAGDDYRPPESGRQRSGRAGMAGDGGPLPSGVVRHTETVKVTTRHTIVSPPDDGRSGYLPGSGTVYGGAATGGGWSGGDHPEPGYGDRRGPDDWSGAAGSGPRPVPEEGSRYDDRPHRDQPAWDEERSGDHGRGEGRRRSHRRAAPEPGDGEGWSDLRAGDRWASVRDDERGRELRVGERQAALRTDSSGTELRVADRWAAMRQAEPRWGGSGGEADAVRPATARAPGGYWSERAGQPWVAAGPEPDPEPSRAFRSDPESSRAFRSEPESSRAFRPEPEPRNRRYRDDDQEYGYPPAGDVPRAGGTRRAEYDSSDGHWR